MYLDFHQFDGIFAALEDGDPIVLIGYGFAGVRYASEDHIHETGNSIIFRAFREREGEMVVHVRDGRFGPDDVGPRTFLDDDGLLAVMLILYLADELLDDILERDDARSLSMLIGDDRHLDMESLEILQEMLDLLALGHEMGRSDEPVEVDLGVGAESGKEILQIDDADDLVYGSAVDRDPGISFDDDGIEMGIEILIDIDGVNTAPRHVDLTHSLIIELKDVLDKFVAGLSDDAPFFRLGQEELYLLFAMDIAMCVSLQAHIAHDGLRQDVKEPDEREKYLLEDDER